MEKREKTMKNQSDIELVKLNRGYKMVHDVIGSYTGSTKARIREKKLEIIPLAARIREIAGTIKILKQNIECIELAASFIPKGKNPEKGELV